MAGPERDRIAELIVGTGNGLPSRRGSGYRITDGAVLTAAHVVSEGHEIRVRFNADLSEEWSVPAEIVAADLAADIAVVGITPPGPEGSVTPVPFGRVGDRAAMVPATAVGFPLFKLRRDQPPWLFRDSHQANGTISPLANWREGTLELLVAAPAAGPDRRSPWEGMSGAAVWSKGRIIGVVSRHHLSDGLGSLAVARLDRLYGSAEPGASAVMRALAGFPAESDLVDVGDYSVPEVGDCPYRGLESFTEDDTRFFFGREKVTAELAGAVSAQPLTALIGASGSGKSSVLSAGLIPAVSAAADSRPAFYCIRITPGPDPVGMLTSAISAWSGTLPGEGWDGSRDQIADMIGSATIDQPFLLIVDQMEELQTLGADEAARRTFIRGLLTLIEGDSPRHRVVIGVRSDFEGYCFDDPDLGPALERREIRLRAMGRPELRSIIEKPAELAALHVDPRLTELLLADVGDEPGKLPLLSHALLATFNRRRGAELTVEDYLAAGGVQGALNKTADETFESLDLAEREIAQAIFIRCTAGDGSGPDTRRPVRRGDLDPAAFPGVDTVLDRLARARLITVTEPRTASQPAGRDEQIVEIVHEALIRSWGRMGGWLDAYRSFRPAHQDLVDAAQRWEQSRRSPGWLYPRARLAEAEKLGASGSPVRLTRTEQDFLAASRASAKRHRFRTRLLSSAVVLALVAASGGATLWARAVGQTHDQQRIAAASKVVQEASEVTATNPGLARQLLVAAHRIQPSDQTTGALLNSGSMPREYDFRGPVSATAYSSRAPILAVGTNQAITLMNSTTGALISTITHGAQYTTALAFSPRRDLLAAGGRDVIRLWNIGDPSRPVLEATLRQFQETSIDTLAFAAAGTLAATLDNNAVALFDTTNPAAPVLLSTLRGYATAPLYPASAVSKDGRLLAAGGPDDSVRLWNITSPAHPVLISTFTGTAPAVQALAFSPDGHLLADDSAQGNNVGIWDITDPRHPDPRPALSTGVLDGPALAFSPSGSALAVAAGNSAQLWDLADPIHPSQLTTLTGDTDSVNALAFSPDGQALATGSEDNTMCLWDITNAGNSTPIADLQADAGAAAVFSPRGHLMIAGDPPVIWNIADPAQPSQLAALPASSTAFSQDGQMVAAEENDGTITLQTMTDPRHPRVIGQVSGPFDATVAFTSPTTLAATADATVRRWDVKVAAHPVPLPSIRMPHALAQGSSLAGTYALMGISHPGYSQAMASLASRRNADILAISPDGRTAATGGSGYAVNLWNISHSPATRIATLSAPSQEIQAVFSPSGKTLAVASPQGLTLWDVSSITHAVLITTLTTPGGFVAASFSPAGNVLSTTNQDGTIQLWQMNIPAIVRQLCTGIGATISPSQWTHYIPGIPYAAPCAAHEPPAAAGTTLITAAPSVTPHIPVHQRTFANAPPLNLHRIDWAKVPIPGQFCEIRGFVQLRERQANASSAWWGQMTVYEIPSVIYGNLGRNAGTVAAVNVVCSVAGSPTADAERANAYIIFTGIEGKLASIGAITPQVNLGSHISIFRRLIISPGSISVEEEWYRADDPTCCPTGKATTIWTYRHGRLVPGNPDIKA